MALQCEQIFSFPLDLDGDEEAKGMGPAQCEKEEVELTFESGEIERDDDIDGE